MQQQQMKRPAESGGDTKAAKKTHVCTLEHKFTVESTAIAELWDDFNDETDGILTFANDLVLAADKAIRHPFEHKAIRHLFEPFGLEGEARIPVDPNGRIYKIMEVPMEKLKAHVEEFEAGTALHGGESYIELERDINLYRLAMLGAFIEGVAAVAAERDWSNEDGYDIERCSNGDEIDKKMVEDLLRAYVEW